MSEEAPELTVLLSPAAVERVNELFPGTCCALGVTRDGVVEPFDLEDVIDFRAQELPAFRIRHVPCGPDHELRRLRDHLGLRLPAEFIDDLINLANGKPAARPMEPFVIVSGAEGRLGLYSLSPLVQAVREAVNTHPELLGGAVERLRNELAKVDHETDGALG